MPTPSGLFSFFSKTAPSRIIPIVNCRPPVSNIFVDKEWNMTYLINLEWICSLPPEMLNALYWLTGRFINEIEAEYLNEFNKVSREFMDILKSKKLLR